MRLTLRPGFATERKCRSLCPTCQSQKYVESYMPQPTRISKSPPASVEQALERLGRNIRTARLRRRLPQEVLARRMGVSRFVVADVERGKASTGVAACVGALWGPGLPAPVRDVADPDRDEEGKTLERARRPRSARLDTSLSDDL